MSSIDVNNAPAADGTQGDQDLGPLAWVLDELRKSLDGAVKAMELRDKFGQSTQIVFENLRLNVVHDPAIFRFVPPEGVDVFGVGG